MIQWVDHDHEPECGPAKINTAPSWDGPSDPAYLLREIEELLYAAQKGGYGTLAYLLNRAAEEARAQARRKGTQQRKL
jgi:hypothetical protein